MHTMQERMTQPTHKTQRSFMYIPEMLIQGEQLDRLKQAHESRLASRAAELRRLQRVQQRAESRLRKARDRIEELRSIEGAG